MDGRHQIEGVMIESNVLQLVGATPEQGLAKMLQLGLCVFA
jgi:hypothetical protein